MRSPSAIRIVQIAAILWTALFIGGCIVLPLAALLWNCNLRELLDPSLLGVVTWTAFQAALSTLISMPLGVALGLAVWRMKIPTLFLPIPFGIPTVVVGVSFIHWLGRAGILARSGISLDWAYSFKAIILAHVFLNAPWMAHRVSEARRKIPALLTDASQSLGASRWMRFRLVYWPYLGPTILFSAIQIFTLCVMSFSLVLLLGGGPPVVTLETALFHRLRQGGLDLTQAVACGVWEFLLTAPPWIWVLTKAKVFSAEWSPPRNSRQRITVGMSIIAAFVTGFFLIPYLPILLHGMGHIFRVGFGSDHRLRQEDWVGALGVSFQLALTSGILSILTSIASMIVLRSQERFRGSLLILLALPSCTSVLVLGLGGWILYQNWIDPFEGSFAAMAILQATIFSPIMLRILWPVALRQSTHCLDAARGLGASAWTAFWIVEWPQWRGPLLSAFAVAFGMSLGEVAAASLFSNEKLVPIPYLITRWMLQYRFEDAYALAALLLLLTAGSMGGLLFISRLRESFGESEEK